MLKEEVEVEGSKISTDFCCFGALISFSVTKFLAGGNAGFSTDGFAVTGEISMISGINMGVEDATTRVDVAITGNVEVVITTKVEVELSLTGEVTFKTLPTLP